MAAVAEEECNSVKGSQAYGCIDDSGDKRKIRTENGCDQIKVENSHQSPVQTSNNH